MPTPPLPAWPDITERDRWTAALADAARRVQQDRGVADDWWLEVAYGNLWAHYGQNRVTVAGPGLVVIEEVHGACPGHWHPMHTGPSAAGPVWRCPDDEWVAVPIGRLVELRAPDEGAPG